MDKITIEKINLTLYAVRNKEGKWFRSKGMNGYGESWVEDINKAKIYPKIGQARSRVTYWSNAFPKYGIPDLVKINATSFEIVEETTRVNKAKERKEKQEKERALRQKQRDLEYAQRQLKEAQETLSRLNK